MYRQEDLICVAKRENNRKRNYVLVNPLQGKHVPVNPGKAMELFECLVKPLQEAYGRERLLLIGFAETATAIGAVVAAKLGALYMQTTRENIPGVDFFMFSEDHSHATEQKLVKDDIDSVIAQVDRVIFIEDEVTTGRTILHIIDVLKSAYPDFSSYGVASILNGMDPESLNAYKVRGIALHYLVKTDSRKYGRAAEKFRGDGIYVPAALGREMAGVKEIRVGGAMNARRLVSGRDYKNACEKLWDEISRQAALPSIQKLLVIGTEEFMYPGLYVAGQAEEAGMDVHFHATTRSPIAVSGEADYPLHVRYELRSLYESGRVTFLYDIGAYDAVWIVTDAGSDEREGIHSLVNALRRKNKGPVTLVRWCED